METYRKQRYTEQLSRELTQISDFTSFCAADSLSTYISYLYSYFVKNCIVVFEGRVYFGCMGGHYVPGRLYVARLLSLLPLPAVQQLMLQSLWLEQELGHVSASQG